MLRRKSITGSNHDKHSPSSTHSSSNAPSISTLCASVGTSQAGKKRKNPFSCSPLKPRRLNPETSVTRDVADSEFHVDDGAKDLCGGEKVEEDSCNDRMMLFEQLDKYEKNTKTACSNSFNTNIYGH